MADVPVCRKVRGAHLSLLHSSVSSRMDLEAQAEVITSAVTLISVQVKDPAKDSQTLYSRVGSDWIKRV